MDSTTIENKAAESELIAEYSPLKKHSYPISIKMFLILIPTLFLFLMTRFLFIDMPFHKEISMKIIKAEKLFLNKDYGAAAALYYEINHKWPQFKIGKIRLAQISFSLINSNPRLYEAGFTFLADGNYTNSEISEIRNFLPPQYIEDFNSRFTRAKSA